MLQLRQFVRSVSRTVWGVPTISLATCLILPRSKIVYAYVPKAACTSVKSWLLRYSGECPEYAEAYDRAQQAGLDAPNPHVVMTERFRAKRMSARLVRSALNAPDWFRFTVVRNPLRRMVSAYLDKVVHVRSPAYAIIAAGQAALTERLSRDPRTRVDAERSLTFREFVRALEAADQESLDVHFRAQSRLLRGLKFDHVGQLEKMPGDFAAVQRAVGVAAPLSWRRYREYSLTPNECVADCPASEFRTVDVPEWPAFYDDELRRSVHRLFAEDLERFGMETEVGARRAA